MTSRSSELRTVLFSALLLAGCKEAAADARRCPAPSVQIGDGCYTPCEDQPGVFCDEDGLPLRPAPTETPDASRPIDAAVVPEDLTPVDVALGERHTCVLTATGAVYCVGDDSTGQLGGSSQVLPIPDFAARHLIAFDTFTCAVGVDEGVWCWGANPDAAFGRIEPAIAWEPVEVPGLQGIAGLRHGKGPQSRTRRWQGSFAYDTSGAVYEVGGFDGHGELRIEPEPWREGLLTSAFDHYSHGDCWVAADGDLYCTPQLFTQFEEAEATEDDRIVRIRTRESDGTFSPIRRIRELACGALSACFMLLENGALYSFGYHADYITGHPYSADLPAPNPLDERVVPPMRLDAAANGRFVDVATGERQACAVYADGRLICWGRAISDDTTQLVEMPGVDDAERVFMGRYAAHICFIRSGLLYCTGEDGHGQLGGSSSTRPLRLGPL